METETFSNVKIKHYFRYLDFFDILFISQPFVETLINLRRIVINSRTAIAGAIIGLLLVFTIQRI